jgi:alkanesulfonate monooxygenase SsuD/methylene tetrahydromethanopterin reductase-like flavin-dependent oxidoreductase (luciferase family)
MSVQDHYPGRGRSVPEFYAEVMAQGERVDALGYDAFFLAEHHFHEYGAVPDPSVFLASLAQRNAAAATALDLGADV